jgi:large subunit ribosomal protein L20
MTRVKGGAVSKNRRRKVLKNAKGYFGSKHRLYKTAQEQVFHSGAYSFQDRKKRSGDFRKLWITRINAACRANDITYSKFINGLKKANININRKMLSELAIFAPEDFNKLVDMSKVALEGKVSKKEPKEVETKVEKTIEDKKDYSKLTVAELKDLCNEKNIEVTATMKKADLVTALEK